MSLQSKMQRQLELVELYSEAAKQYEALARAGQEMHGSLGHLPDDILAEFTGQIARFGEAIQNVTATATAISANLREAKQDVTAPRLVDMN